MAFYDSKTVTNKTVLYIKFTYVSSFFFTFVGRSKYVEMVTFWRQGTLINVDPSQINIYSTSTSRKKN